VVNRSLIQILKRVLDPVKVVFIHHHLRQGGVTRVIDEQIQAIRDVHDVLVITGEAPSAAVSFPVKVIPSLSYDRDRREGTGADKTALEVMGSVRSFWGSDADLFHVHNPTLGKNRDFIGVLKEIQRRGGRLLLQIHDFAEDGRPGNYTGETYPENCHYAAINSRDYDILKQAGLNERGLHLIPNAVRPLHVSAHGAGQSLILYPVRAIRRKNIGEALLLSHFIAEQKRIAITLEPTSALDIKSYKAWMSFAAREGLPVLFGVGKEKRFEQLLARAHCILTTSIKEGFGLAFLESWMGNRPLVGRLLPDICADFIQRGLRLNHLYTGLFVPLKLIDYNRFGSKWERCYRRRLELYGLEVDDTAIRNYLKGIQNRGSLDFGELSEDQQMHVISLVKHSSREREALMDVNPFLREGCGSGDWDDLVSYNRGVVSREYSAHRNRERLLQIYERVESVTPRQRIRGEKLLNLFNSPEASRLLLSDYSYDE
jgi:glycosyltransferase involved in cell wall biosynthesis